MEIDFLALLKFVQSKKENEIYEKFISQIKTLESNPEKEIEISIPKDLIKEFMRINEEL